MERLISDANEYAATIGESSDMTIDSFADVVRAIDLIQRKQGIAGNAGAETLKTISGSLGATKAAWDNFLTSLGTGDDMLVQQAIGGLVNTVFGTWSDETRKREGGLINNLSKTLKTIFNSVAKYVPQLMSRFAYSIIEGIGNAFGFDTSGIEEKFDRVWDIIDRFKTTVTNGWGTFVGWIQQVWDGFTSKFDSSGFELALANVKQILADVWGFVEEHIIPLAPTVGEFLGYAVSALGKVLAAITELVRFVEPYVAQALLWLGDLTGRFWEFAKAHEDLRDFVKSAWEVIKRVVGEFVEQVKTAIVEKFEAIRTATVDKWQAVKDAIAAKVQAAKDAVVERFNTIRESIRTTVDNIKTSMTEKWNNIKTTITEKVDAVKKAITDKFTAAKEKALGIFDDIKKGIRDKIQWAKEQVSKIIDDIKGLFDFSWSLPAPKLPHITWSWQDVGGIVSIPSFGVDWYGKGGVFDTATLIGIGEKGREAALPLNDRTYREIADGISKQAGGSVGVTITGNSFVVREEADIDRIAAELDRRIRRERMAMA